MNLATARTLTAWGLVVSLLALLPAPDRACAQSRVDEAPTRVEGVLNADQGRMVIQNAARAYYSLRAQGLEDFRCQARPDWDVILKYVEPDERTRRQLFPVLSATPIVVMVSSSAPPSVTHTRSSQAPDPVADRADALASGMGQFLRNALLDWAGFTVAPPFSKGNFTAEHTGDGYRLTRIQGSDEISVLLNHDYSMRHLRRKTSQYVNEFNTTFNSSSSGFLLERFELNLKRADGLKEHAVTRFEYQNVGGFTLPHKVFTRSEISIGAAGEIPFTLDSCEVHKR